MARKMKIAIPILTDEELTNIDENWQSMAEKFIQETMHEKDLCIAHRIIKKQQEEIDRLNNILSDPKDLTLCKMWADTKLQDEVERLSNELNQQFIKCDKYMTRNEKAIEYIHNNYPVCAGKELLSILQGEDK